MTKAIPLLAIFGLLSFMFFLSGGAALHESPTVDEIAHVGAGLSYWQRLDLRMNPEHPPLGKALAGLSLAIRGTRADYSSPSWQMSTDFVHAFLGEWVFGEAVLGRWNDWKSTLAWARLPMLLLTLVLGIVLYRYAARLGGTAGGLLCLAAFVTTPAFLAFGPLVITDVPVTLFTLIALWRLGAIWAEPSRRNAWLFGAGFAGALLSKFTGLLIFPIIVVLFLQTRIWPTAAQPSAPDARKLWRRTRWRCVLRGCGWAILFTYLVYLVFSWNQADDALRILGSSRWAGLVRHPLMPPLIFGRGLFLLLVSSVRPTYLFGQVHSHGLLYYFPTVFAFKSTLGFLLLCVTAGVAAILCRRAGKSPIPEPYRPHVRVLMVGFFLVLGVCLLSQMDMGIRHFLLPIVLLILMLAPLPRMIRALPHPHIWQTAVILLAAASFVSVASVYPHFIAFVNSFSLRRPAYYLLNDSNVSWNESLPDVERFVREQHLPEIALDWASLSDPAVIVPEARVWDCQNPSEADAGQWVAVASVSILENHNCGYLQQYPHRLLGGGFYAFKLPSPIPPAGSPGGPPLPSESRVMWGLPMDFRGWAVNIERHPEHLVEETNRMIQRMQDEYQKRFHKK